MLPNVEGLLVRVPCETLPEQVQALAWGLPGLVYAGVHREVSMKHALLGEALCGFACASSE